MSKALHDAVIGTIRLLEEEAQIYRRDLMEELRGVIVQAVNEAMEDKYNHTLMPLGHILGIDADAARGRIVRDPELKKLATMIGGQYRFKRWQVVEYYRKKQPALRIPPTRPPKPKETAKEIRARTAAGRAVIERNRAAKRDAMRIPVSRIPLERIPDPRSREEEIISLMDEQKRDMRLNGN